MDVALSILILVSTLASLFRFTARYSPEPGYDWPVVYYRVKLWWAARRRPTAVTYYRTALGRIPGESEHDWDRRQDARAK